MNIQLVASTYVKANQNKRIDSTTTTLLHICNACNINSVINVISYDYLRNCKLNTRKKHVTWKAE